MQLKKIVIENKKFWLKNIFDKKEKLNFLKEVKETKIQLKKKIQKVSRIGDKMYAVERLKKIEMFEKRGESDFIMFK